MIEYKPKAEGILRDPRFRELLDACAGNSAFVSRFNALHGFDLPCPISVLVAGTFPSNLTDEEHHQIGCFVAFVLCNFWEEHLRAHAQMGRHQYRYHIDELYLMELSAPN